MISREEHRARAAQSEDRAANVPGLYNGTLYLARRELRRTWRSYIWALLVAPVLGVTAAFLLAADSGQDAASDYQLYPAVLNGVFIFLIAVLPRASAWHSGASGSTGWGAPVGGHLSFLHSLPLTVEQITAARALASVTSVMVLCAVFFTPLYLLSGSLRGELGAVEYLLFVAFWVGSALAFESVGLFTELSFPGTIGFLVYMLMLCASAGVATGMAGQGASAVDGVVRLTQNVGALPTLVALTGGCVALAISWLATARRIRKKELR